MDPGVRHAFFLATIAAIVGLPPLAQSAEQAEDGPGENLALSRKLSVGIGAGVTRFDTNFKFTDPGSGRSIFVDAESTLGLPESKTIPLIYGYWRPSQRHGLGFSYFSVRRESELLAIDANYEDLFVDGVARLTDSSRFYALTYNYTFFQDSRALLFASVGINTIDLEYQLKASGEVVYDGEPVSGGTFNRSVSQVAPIPTIGLDSWFVLTPEWSFGARVAFVAGNIAGVKALITESRIRARYTVNRNLGLYFGVSYFDGSITISKDDLITDIKYGFDGLILGVDAGF